MSKKKRLLLYLMSAGFTIAGINHFVHPYNYTIIVPTIFSDPLLIVQLSGIAEILCGLGFLPIKTRSFAAWATIALLIAVFPANIKMTLDYANNHNPMLWITILRLPMQFLLIWWAWLFTLNDGTKGPEIEKQSLET